jgi:two-component system, cell cycle response regulator
MSGRAGPSNPPDLHEQLSAFVDDTRTMDGTIGFGEAPLVLASNGPARALLMRLDGVHAGAVFAVDHLPCTIGRHTENTLRIDEDSISRFHARISRDEQGYHLEDLQSRNGTFVGGKRVTQHRLKDGEGITFGTKASFHFNVSDTLEERLLRRLYESSTRDALTGAYNRSHFDERLRAEIAFASRHAAEMALIMIDVDHFKRVNDTYGHQAGDLVLKELVNVAQRSLRTEDIFARFGGEEFAIILRGINLVGAYQLAERLRLALAGTPIAADAKTIRVTLSAGCATMTCCAAPVAPTELIRVADRRLYLAKTSGRNRVVAEG